jgi:hypothetical protein
MFVRQVKILLLSNFNFQNPCLTPRSSVLQLEMTTETLSKIMPVLDAVAASFWRSI